MGFWGEIALILLQNALFLGGFPYSVRPEPLKNPIFAPKWPIFALFRGGSPGGRVSPLKSSNTEAETPIFRDFWGFRTLFFPCGWNGGFGGAFFDDFWGSGLFFGLRRVFFGLQKVFFGLRRCFLITVDILDYVRYFWLRWIFWISDVGYIGF